MLLCDSRKTKNTLFPSPNIARVRELGRVAAVAGLRALDPADIDLNRIMREGRESCQGWRTSRNLGCSYSIWQRLEDNYSCCLVLLSASR